VVVIGGGITGAGVALDAAARGLSTVLVERDDLAAGTSSKSSKLVHGGLRYLSNGEIRLVYEALRERGRLMHNAPHLVHQLAFMIPILTRDGVVSRKIARALGSAMWMYDLTGGWRIGRLHRRIGADAAHALVPTMPRERLSSAYLYYDASGDDARITLTIARTAADHGALVATRSTVVGVVHDADGRATGVDLADGLDGSTVRLAARSIINASGVWVDDVRELDEGAHPGTIRPAKGVHISVPWSLVRNEVALVIPVRRDKRSLFLVPWGPLGDGTFRHTYVGTTDTEYDGPLDAPDCTDADIDYILEAMNASLTCTISRADITGVWAGLRPLVAAEDDSTGTADLSRRHSVTVGPSGIVTVTGGKLTTYREMAEDTLDVAIGRVLDGRNDSSDAGSDAVSDAVSDDLLRRWKRAHRRHPTRRMRLRGARSIPAKADLPTRHLIGRFGTAADDVRALVALNPTLGEPLVAGLPYIRAEAVYAVRHEMATSLLDVLLRRTRAHLFDRAACLDAVDSIGSLLADELGWDAIETERQIQDYRRICADEEAAAHVAAHRSD